MNEELEHTVFLEVQVQNISAEPLLFNKLNFGPAEGLEVQDLTIRNNYPVQPGDVLQCLYIIKPKPKKIQDIIAKARLANNAMGLGRLEIRWSGRMGDAGHLTTSQLVRHLPMPFVPPALASRQTFPHQTSNLATPDRPFRSGLRSPSPRGSPHLGTGTATPSPRQSVQIDEPLLLPFGSDIQTALYTLPPESTSFATGKPFELHFRLSLTSTCRNPSSGKKRRLRLAAQHVDHHSPLLHQLYAPESRADPTQTGSARQSLETSRPLPPTPRRSEDNQATIWPPPHPLPEGHPYDARRSDQRHLKPSQGVRFYGNTLLELPEVSFDHGSDAKPSAAASDEADQSDPRISIDSTATDDVPLDQVARKGVAKRQQTQTVHFSLQYVSFTHGIHTVGGVRVMVVEDSWLDGDAEEAGQPGPAHYGLIEHSIVAEVVIGS